MSPVIRGPYPDVLVFDRQADLWTDFASNALGDPDPAIWTYNAGSTYLVTKSDGGSIGGKILRFDSDNISTSGIFLNWDSQPSYTEGELLIKMRSPVAAYYKIATTFGGVQVALDMPSPSTSSGAVRFGFPTGVPSVNSGQPYNRYVNSYSTSSAAAGVWFWMRVRIKHPTIYAKLWVDGQPEPASWMVYGSTTSGAFPGGKVTMHLSRLNSATNQPREADYIAVKNTVAVIANDGSQNATDGPRVPA